jgi:hypothetical protein
MIKLLILCGLIGAAPEAKKKLPLPGYISPQLRKVLDKRMEHHGTAAMGLTVAVVLLEHDDVAELALKIADAPGLSRVRNGQEDTLNALLPERFFAFQDQLKRRARELADAASKRDNEKIHAAFSRLTQSCMGCHAAYLNGPGSELPIWPVDPSAP